MSDTPRGKMGDFLREVSNWSWDELWRAERNKTYTSNQAIVFTLIRACASENLKAIRLSLNRMDGKLKTPVVIETPKIYWTYPYATVTDGENENLVKIGTITPIPAKESPERAELEQNVPLEGESDLPSLSLRETLNKMSDYARDTPDALVEQALRTEMWLRGEGSRPNTIPRVKAVVAAHLLVMAANKNIDAMTEVFDQIDGKLAETIQVIGEDISMISYATTAPAGAIKNKDGVYQMEASMAQDVWARKLGGTGGAVIDG